MHQQRVEHPAFGQQLLAVRGVFAEPFKHPAFILGRGFTIEESVQQFFLHDIVITPLRKTSLKKNHFFQGCPVRAVPSGKVISWL